MRLRSGAGLMTPTCMGPPVCFLGALGWETLRSARCQARERVASRRVMPRASGQTDRWLAPLRSGGRSARDRGGPDRNHPGKLIPGVSLFVHRSGRPDQAIADGLPGGLVGGHEDDDQAQVQAVALVKARVKPLAGLREDPRGR